MSKEEITAHDTHYDSGNMKDYQQALFQAFDEIGHIALDSEIRDFTCSLWLKGFVIAPVEKQPNDRAITPDLLEEYGFIPDEPGHWFLENPDDPLDLSVRVSESLRKRGQWELFVDGGIDEDDLQVKLTSFQHLLSVLKDELDITFEDEGGEE